MPIPTRETVKRAVLAFLQTNCGTTFKFYTRRWVEWVDNPTATAPPGLPFLSLLDTPIAESYVRQLGSGLPPKRVLEMMVLVADKVPVGETPGTPNGVTPASQVVGPLVEAVENALLTDLDSNGLQTIGGLVVDCGVDGEIVQALGDVDPSGAVAAIIPLKVLVQ